MTQEEAKNIPIFTTSLKWQIGVSYIGGILGKVLASYQLAHVSKNVGKDGCDQLVAKLDEYAKSNGVRKSSMIGNSAMRTQAQLKVIKKLTPGKNTEVNKILDFYTKKI